MKYIKDHIPASKSKRPKTRIIPRYITIHSTGNANSTARNERDWLTNPSNNRSASWHICVDEKEAIEAIPLNEVAYHSGTAQGNNSSISIEICESGNREKTLRNAVELTAKLLKERGWGVDRLKRHYNWSGKNCPRIMSANNWAGWKSFVAQVKKELENMEEITVFLKGEKKKGLLIDGTTFIPLREFAEKLGLKVSYIDGKAYLG